MRALAAALVLSVTAAVPAYAASVDSGCFYQVAAGDFLAVKAAPSLSSPRVGKIPAGKVTVIYGLDEPGEWARFPGFIQPDRQTFTYTKMTKGWVNTRFLKKLDCFG